MNKNVIELINHSTSTLSNIAEMTQYRIKYLQDRDAEAKEKMNKHAFFAILGVFSLVTMRVLGLMGNSKNS